MDAVCTVLYLPGVSVVMATSLLYHVMTGKGSPVAEQEKRNELSSMTVTKDVFRADIVGGTVHLAENKR